MNSKIQVWDVHNNYLLKFSFEVDGNPATSLTILKDGSLVSGHMDGTIRIWNISSGYLINTILAHSSKINSLVILKNGDLVSGSDDKSIKIWDSINGYLKFRIDGHNGPVQTLDVTADLGNLISGSADKTVKKWNTSASK
jgi:WD40 repeat protein